MNIPDEPFVPVLEPAARPSIRLRLRWVRHAFRALALLAIGLGALGLHVEQLQPAGTMRGLNIVLVIDASRSMLAQDFEPNRLGSATRLTEEFVKRRPGDRFGLVTFAGDVILECPITVDRGALVATIRDVSTLNRSDGTALGEAIASGVARLKTTPANGRVILILSDGAGNTGRMTSEEAATLAAAQNVRVYAVGIGATGPVPYPTEFGMLSVVLDLDDAVLRQVTATTGGEYFRAADSRTLEMAFDKLDRLEPAEFVLPARRRRLPLTPAFALLALAALLVEEILAASVFRSLTR